MTESTPGWATPGARSAPATHWPPSGGGSASSAHGHEQRTDVYHPASAYRPAQPVHRPPPNGTPIWQGREYRPMAPLLRQPISVPRPTFRETGKITPVGVAGGAGATVLWFVVTTLLGVNLVSTMWVMLVASLFAMGAALLLARYGDRGAATGIAAVAGAASAVVGLVVEWHAFGDTWILW